MEARENGKAVRYRMIQKSQLASAILCAIIEEGLLGYWDIEIFPLAIVFFLLYFLDKIISSLSEVSPIVIVDDVLHNELVLYRPFLPWRVSDCEIHLHRHLSTIHLTSGFIVRSRGKRCIRPRSLSSAFRHTYFPPGVLSRLTSWPNVDSYTPLALAMALLIFHFWMPRYILLYICSRVGCLYIFAYKSS